MRDHRAGESVQPGLRLSPGANGGSEAAGTAAATMPAFTIPFTPRRALQPSCLFRITTFSSASSQRLRRQLERSFHLSRKTPFPFAALADILTAVRRDRVRAFITVAEKKHFCPNVTFDTAFASVWPLSLEELGPDVAVRGERHGRANFFQTVG